jgi:hypothetical protein
MEATFHLARERAVGEVHIRGLTGGPNAPRRGGPPFEIPHRQTKGRSLGFHVTLVA